jgi:uncharacterized membrane protein
MLFSTRIASILFAIALAGWGIIHFLLGDFAAGRAPSWPDGVPGKMIWAYVSGIILIVAAISILSNQKTRLTVACAGVMILLWAGGRNLFDLLSTLDYGTTLTKTGKALTFGGACLMIALNKRYSFIIACVCIGLFFTASGIQYFIFIDFVKTLVPRWIPGDVFWSYVAGVGLIAIGVSLITGIKRELASFIGSWMVFIWFLVLHVPRGFGETQSFNEWIAIFEALAVSAILAIIYWKEKSPVSR